MMSSVESYVEIEKRLEEISAFENHDTLPHQNILFITKHEKEKPGRMRIVQDTSYWFWYPDGLRKFKVGPIQDDNQPQDVKSNEFPIGLKCRDQACTARGVIYVTDADLRGEKRIYDKVGNYYHSSDCDIDQTYPKRSLFECYSRVSINGEHSCKAIKMKEGITALVRDHVLAREKMPDLPEKDEFGYEIFHSIEDKVFEMVADEAFKMRRSEHRKLYEIGFDEIEIGRICKVQLKRLEFQQTKKICYETMRKCMPGVSALPEDSPFFKIEELPLGASYSNAEQSGQKKKTQKSKKKTDEDPAWRPGSSKAKTTKKKNDRKRKQADRADEDSAEEGTSKKGKPKKA